MNRTAAIVVGCLGVVVILLFLLHKSEFRADYQVRQAERRLNAAEFDRDFGRRWDGTLAQPSREFGGRPAPEDQQMQELQARADEAREEFKRRQRELEQQTQASRVTEDKLRKDLNKFIEGEEQK